MTAQSLKRAKRICQQKHKIPRKAKPFLQNTNTFTNSKSIPTSFENPKRSTPHLPSNNSLTLPEKSNQRKFYPTHARFFYFFSGIENK